MITTDAIYQIVDFLTAAGAASLISGTLKIVRGEAVGAPSVAQPAMQLRRPALSPAAERQRRFRERKRLEADQLPLPLLDQVTVTPVTEANVTPVTTAPETSRPTDDSLLRENLRVSQSESEAVTPLRVTDGPTDDRFVEKIRAAVNGRCAPDLFKPSAVESFRAKVAACDLESDIVPAVADFARHARAPLRKLDNVPLVETILARARERTVLESKPKAPSLVRIQIDTPEWRAWTKARGKSLPVADITLNGRRTKGWDVPTRWPAGAEPVEQQATASGG